MATLVELSPAVWVVAVTPFAKTEVDDSDPVNPWEVTLTKPANIVLAVPKFISVVPIVTESLTNAALGTELAPKLKSKVSVPAVAVILRPASPPEPEVKFKVPSVLFATRFVPLNDAVAKAWFAVAEVIYPESLLNCEISEPDTATFFQSAILYYLILLYIL